MDFSFTEEHDELRRTVRRFLDEESPDARVRTLMETEHGYDRDTWRLLAEEVALAGLVVPESYGGAGLGPVELAIAMEEMGRALFCAPFLSTAVLAVHVLRDAALEEPRARLLPAIAAGRSTATVALPESGDVVATVDGGSWRLDGTCTRVIDGCTANVLLVVARAGDEVALFDVEGSAPGVERSALPTLDLTRKLARVAFRAAPATRASDGDSIAGLPRAVRATIAALAAEQVGGAERCLEQAAEYSKTRLQFGRPIGSYQAIKHKCADMLVEVELARSAAYHAAFRALADEDDAAMAAHMAKAYCSEAYVHAAADNIQIHGGMGFTWEHPAHLHFKRAKASSVMFGDPVLHRREIARALDL